jgi:hypothetical protein
MCCQIYLIIFFDFSTHVIQSSYALIAQIQVISIKIL